MRTHCAGVVEPICSWAKAALGSGFRVGGLSSPHNGKKNISSMYDLHFS